MRLSFMPSLLVTVALALPFATAVNAQEAATAIRPYTIQVADAVIEDLKARLALTRIPDQIPNTGWDYGTDMVYLRELIDYWRNDFDWREQESALNEFDQFVTQIDGVDVHFSHQRSTHEDAMPLLLTHGWPGSIAEFRKIIGPLTQPEL